MNTAIEYILTLEQQPDITYYFLFLFFAVQTQMFC